jgi:hypothetical protein
VSHAALAAPRRHVGAAIERLLYVPVAQPNASNFPLIEIKLLRPLPEGSPSVATARPASDRPTPKPHLPSACDARRTGHSMLSSRAIISTGRWKVVEDLADRFAELALYHREESRVVKSGDDLISASRYALIMLRHAQAAHDDAWSRPIKYGPSGLV